MWGLADLFYKMGTDEDDRYSHLKIGIWVGLVMGLFAFILMPFAETPVTFASLITNAVKYAPASISYIISMIIGYAGLRYMEVSIISPIQNSSGGLACLAMGIYFVLSGTFGSLFEEFSVIEIGGTAIIFVGIIALSFVEQQYSNEYNLEHGSVAQAQANSTQTPQSQKAQSQTASARTVQSEPRKYRMGVLAFVFPICYCIFDTIGTAADGIILDETTGLGLGEIDILILYGLTFFITAIICWLFILIKTGKPYNPFTRREITRKGIAALSEEGGQIFYVYAMAANPMMAAPIISAYCGVSIILSRIFLKEKLSKAHYACLIAVLIGIVIMGFAE